MLLGTTEAKFTQFDLNRLYKGVACLDRGVLLESPFSPFTPLKKKEIVTIF